MYRRVLFFVVLFGAAALSSWAETGSSGSSDGKTLELTELDNSLKAVTNFFTSGVMKTIFSIGLGGLFIALALNRENPDLKNDSCSGLSVWGACLHFQALWIPFSPRELCCEALIPGASASGFSFGAAPGIYYVRIRHHDSARREHVEALARAGDDRYLLCVSPAHQTG